MPYKKNDFGAASTRIVYATAGGVIIYNEYLAWELTAPAGGLQIRHLHIDPILLTNAQDCQWHVLVFQGKVPLDIRNLQQAVANASYPVGATALGLNLLYYTPLQPTRPSAAQALYPTLLDFIDGCGPSVDAGQTMSIVICPAFLTGSAMTASSDALISGAVFGGPVSNDPTVQGRNAGDSQLFAYQKGTV